MLKTSALALALIGLVLHSRLHPQDSNTTVTPQDVQTVVNHGGFIQGNISQWIFQTNSLPVAEVRNELLTKSRQLAQHIAALPEQGRKAIVNSRLARFQSDCDMFVDLKSQLPRLIDEYLLLQAHVLAVSQPPNYQRAAELLTPIDSDEARIELVDVLLFLRNSSEAARVAQKISSQTPDALVTKIHLALYRLQALPIEEILSTIAISDRLLSDLRYTKNVDLQYTQMDTLNSRLILVTTWFVTASSDGKILPPETPYSDGSSQDAIVSCYLDDLDFMLRERELLAKAIVENGGSVPLRRLIDRVVSYSKYLHDTAEQLRILDPKWNDKATSLIKESTALDKKADLLIDNFVGTHGASGLIEQVGYLRDIALRSNERRDLDAAVKQISELNERIAWAAQQGIHLPIQELHWQDVVGAKIRIDRVLSQLSEKKEADPKTVSRELVSCADQIHLRRVAEIFSVLRPLAWEAYYVAEILSDDTEQKLRLSNLRSDLRVSPQDIESIISKWDHLLTSKSIITSDQFPAEKSHGKD